MHFKHRMSVPGWEACRVSLEPCAGDSQGLRDTQADRHSQSSPSPTVSITCSPRHVGREGPWAQIWRAEHRGVPKGCWAQAAPRGLPGSGGSAAPLPGSRALQHPRCSLLGQAPQLWVVLCRARGCWPQWSPTWMLSSTNVRCQCPLPAAPIPALMNYPWPP